MKAKLKVIKNWEFEEFELTGTSFKYSPMKLCFGPIISRKNAVAFCGSKATFPGGFPARSRKSNKMFGKFLSCSHAIEEYC